MQSVVLAVSDEDAINGRQSPHNNNNNNGDVTSIKFRHFKPGKLTFTIAALLCN